MENLVDFSKYQMKALSEPEQPIEIEQPTKPKKDIKIWVKVPIGAKSPSRLLSGLCAEFGVKGYNNMRKPELFDSIIDYIKNEKENYIKGSEK